MKFVITALLVTILLWTASPVFLQAQDNTEQEKLVERLTVKNIEVPVRVLDGKMLVTDLTQEDFILIEGKDEVPLTGFFVKRKMMGQTGTIEDTKQAPKQAARTFVLAFQITTFTDDLQKAVDHLFDKILRPEDQLMVFANNSTRTFKSIGNPQQIKALLIEDFRTAGEAYHLRLSNYVRRIEDNLKVNDFTRSLRSGAGSRTAGEPDSRPQDLIFFLEKYLGIWEEYKKLYLLPNMDIFYNFSRFLEKTKGEKWVLNFYQFELFPRIRIESAIMKKIGDLAASMSLSTDGPTMALGRRLDQVLKEIYINMNMTRGFPIDEITKMFYKVDATFHSFFIRTRNPSFLQDFSYQTISTELEQLLGSITDATGGRNIVSNDLNRSLDEVQKLEDVYYILTFRPKKASVVAPIKIKMANRKGLTLLYDNNFRADYINEYFQRMEKTRPQVRLEGFSFQNKILTFGIRDFIMKAAEDNKGQKQGQLSIRIRLINQAGNAMFDQKKGFSVTKEEMKVSIPAFKTLPAGEYSFIIDVLDHVSGLSDQLYESIRVK